MGQYIEINNSSIVTGVTAAGSFVVCQVNNKQVTLPLFTFSTSEPDLDFVSLVQKDIRLKNSTIYNQATSYGAAVAVTVMGSAYGLPIYRTYQDSNVDPSLVFRTPTVVSNLEYTGMYLPMEVDGSMYGVPLVNYSSIYPFTSSQAMSTIRVDTVIEMGAATLNNHTNAGSTNLNPKIRTYDQLIKRIKYQLGAPYVNVELCDDLQIVDFIDQAIEWYTKYAGYTEEFLIFSSLLYKEPGLRIDKLFSATPSLRKASWVSPTLPLSAQALMWSSQGDQFLMAGSDQWNALSTNPETPSNVIPAMDYDLGSYRKVVNVFEFQQGETTGINSLFTLEQAMAQQTYFSYMLGNVGFDLVTWEVLKGWLDLREKVLAQIPYIDFDSRNQLMRIIPPPRSNEAYFGIVGCWVEKPIRDLIMERWVGQYALAISKIAIGNARGKFGSMVMFAGGTLNFNDLMTQGLEEKKKLEDELLTSYGEAPPPRFWLR